MGVLSITGAGQIRVCKIRFVSTGENLVENLVWYVRKEFLCRAKTSDFLIWHARIQDSFMGQRCRQKNPSEVTVWHHEALPSDAK